MTGLRSIPALCTALFIMLGWNISQAGDCSHNLACIAEHDVDAGQVPRIREGDLQMTTDSPKAEAAYRLGRHLTFNYEYRNAVEKFREATIHDPDFVLAHVQIGRLVDEEADWRFAKAKAHMPDVSRYERIYASVIIDDHLNHESLSYLHELLPDDHEVLVRMAILRSEYGDTDAATEYFFQALNLYPASTWAWVSAGQHYLRSRDYVRASIALKKAIQITHQRRPQPFVALGHLYLRTWKYEKAINVAEEALDIDPNSWEAVVLIADALTLMGRHASAQKMLLHKLKKSSRTQAVNEYTSALVNSLVDEGKLEDAIKYLSKHYTKLSRKQANDSLSKRIQRGGDIYYLNQLGDTYLEFGDYKTAKEIYDNALRICENTRGQDAAIEEIELRNLYRSARVAARKLDIEDAQQISRKFRAFAEESHFDDLIKYANELDGEIALENSQPELAIEYFEKGVINGPVNRFRIGLAYEMLGDQDNARAYFKKTAEYSYFDRYNYAFVRSAAITKAKAREPLGVGHE